MSDFVIDKNNIEKPRITVGERALQQIRLILSNDYTLEGHSCRILASGKECDGFSYSIGFTLKDAHDFILSVSGEEFLIDPFSAYILQSFHLDYLESEDEGFIVINHSQSKFKGKFWKDNPDLIPPGSEREL